MFKSSEPIFASGFEVFGEVQGVRMRESTRDLAILQGVRGWVMYTDCGTVKGQLEGPLAKVNDLKYWLLSFGSPRAIIDHTQFTQTKEIPTHRFQDFKIRTHPPTNVEN